MVELGLRAVIGVPLTAWGQTIGVLNLYRDRPTSWSDTDIEGAEMLAAMGASYIPGATRMQVQNELAENLHAALAARGTIERAKGIIMQREGVDAHTAFDRLRTTSTNGNQKLRDVARQIIEHHEGQCPAGATEAMSHQRPSNPATAASPSESPPGAANTHPVQDGVRDAAATQVVETSTREIA